MHDLTATEQALMHDVILIGYISGGEVGVSGGGEASLQLPPVDET